MVIDRPNPLWCADITYIPARRGFLYLVAVMDWSTRKALSWFVVTSLDRPASGELAASLSAGHRRCLYRAIDEAGVTADFLLIANQDREAALRFLRKAIKRNGAQGRSRSTKLLPIRRRSKTIMPKLSRISNPAAEGHFIADFKPASSRGGPK
jgi:transposase InsO family protein